MTSPYQVLGVSEGASRDEIRAAYRKLAKLLHPDSGDKRPDTARRFQELTEAYRKLTREPKAGPKTDKPADAHRNTAGPKRQDAPRPSDTTEDPGESLLTQAIEKAKARLAGTKRPSRPSFQQELAKAKSVLEKAGTGPETVVDLPVTLAEAVRGARLRVPTPDGTVLLDLPPNSSSGTVLRLRGKGAPGPLGLPGDLLYRVQIRLPEAPDPELARFIETWRGDDGQDPRRDIEAALKAATRR